MKEEDWEDYKRVEELYSKSGKPIRMTPRKLDILYSFLEQIRRGKSLTEKQKALLEDYEQWYEEAGKWWTMESRKTREKRKSEGNKIIGLGVVAGLIGLFFLLRK